MSTPTLRGLNTVGGTFTNYSYGLGGLQSAAATGGSDLLRSSIYSSGSTSPFRWGAGAAAAGMGAGGFSSLPMGYGRAYQTASYDVRPIDPAAVPGATFDPSKIPAGALLPYLSVMSFKGDINVQDDKPITSLVPSEPGIYQTDMQKGDQAFRAGLYGDAAGPFKLATIIARRAPEGHLCMAHALFAVGQYYTASTYLRDAIKYLPELPLVRLQIRGFYGQPDDFKKQLEELKNRLDTPSPEPELQLLMAYLEYFDGKEAEAIQRLHQAAVARNELRPKKPRTTAPAGKPSPEEETDPVLEAINTFWDGMLAAGKVGGTATQPAAPPKPTSQPADAAVVPPARDDKVPR